MVTPVKETSLTRPTIEKPTWSDVSGDASSAQNPDEELVLSLMHDLSVKDASGLAEYFTDDAMYQNMPLPPAHGRAEVQGLLAMLLSVLSIDHIETLHIASRDGLVHTERIDRLTALPTGKTMDLPVAGVLRVRDGKISEWRDYFDLRQFEEAVEFSLRQ
jgi:limonene-1,2-epoxide hydrolase